MQTYPTGYTESHRMTEENFPGDFTPAQHGGA